jgi:hypothetical protein
LHEDSKIVTSTTIAWSFNPAHLNRMLYAYNDFLYVMELTKQIFSSINTGTNSIHQNLKKNFPNL